jgi:CRP-like cAMP-binding protein
MKQLLAAAEPFKNLSVVQRNELAQVTREKQFKKGETIFREGQPSEAVWIVKTGRVHLVKYLSSGKVSTTCVMSPNETFCCIPALDRKPYPADAVAAQDSVVLRIPINAFHELMTQSPIFADKTLCLFCDRLREMETKGCLSHDRVDRRIARTLLTLQKKFGDSIPMTKQEIADMVDTTVETTIRTISHFQKEGWVQSGRGEIQLLQIDSLKQLLL